MERYTESRKHWYIVIVCRVALLVGVLVYLSYLPSAIERQNPTAIGHIIGMVLTVLFALWQGRGLKLQHFIERIKLPPIFRIPVDTGRYDTIQDVSIYPALAEPAGYVYLLQETSEGYFKIGKTRKPQDRKTTFDVKLPFIVGYICMIQSPNMHVLESTLHRKFASKRVNGEWFALEPADVEYIQSLAGSE